MFPQVPPPPPSPQALALAFIIGSIFYQLGYTQSSITGRVGVLFFVMIMGAFGLSQAAIAFIQERLLVNRERAAGVYHVFPYFMARTLTDWPLQILQTVIFASIMYWMAGLNPAADRFFMYEAGGVEAMCVVLTPQKKKVTWGCSSSAPWSPARCTRSLDRSRRMRRSATFFFRASPCMPGALMIVDSLTSPSLRLFMLFAGFFTSQIPDWWIWLYWWSFL